MRSGDYVRCNFPFREKRGPGPFAHIVLVLGIGRSGNTVCAIVAYTTTRTAYAGARRPRQHLLVDETRAFALGQNKAFIVDVSRIARLPTTKDYFPDLLDVGVPNFGQDPAMANKAAVRIRELIGDGFQVTPVDLTSKP